MEIYPLPSVFVPTANVNKDFESLNSFVSIISLKLTIDGFGLGISIPTADFSGTGSILIAAVFIAREISSIMFITDCIFVPGARTISYLVITGPGIIS